MPEGITPTEERIFDIIRADVCCGTCKANAGACDENISRCYAGYERQAREIYRQVVQPLEKELKNARGLQ